VRQKQRWPLGAKQQYLTGLEHRSQCSTPEFTSTMATWPCARCAWMSCTLTVLWAERGSAGDKEPHSQSCNYMDPSLYPSSFMLQYWGSILSSLCSKLLAAWNALACHCGPGSAQSQAQEQTSVCMEGDPVGRASRRPVPDGPI
jgi:hypothetical protein